MTDPGKFKQDVSKKWPRRDVVAIRESEHSIGLKIDSYGSSPKWLVNGEDSNDDSNIFY